MAQKKAAARRALKIAIDAGPGMSNATSGVFDSGAESAGVREADVTLSYGLALDARLRALNIATFMTRRDNVAPTPVTQRASAAMRAGCTHFISFHLNDADTSDAHGTETLFNDTTKDKPLAIQIQEAVVRASGFRDRGVVQRTNLAVLKFSAGPAVLIELGFISNPQDRADLLDPDVRADIIEAVTSVIAPASGVVAPSGTFEPGLIAPFANAAGVGPASGLFRNITTTEFGGGDETGMSSAYGGVVHGDRPEASLPARLPANKRSIRVFNRATGLEVV